MSNIEKIRQEIERLKKILKENTYYLDNSQQALGYSFALDDFNDFIDSLPEETCKENTDSLTNLKDDLALTWEDMAKIDAIILDVNNEFAVDYTKEIDRQKFYEEVLKRFKEAKK